jgi:beta-phosphoglucomutase
MSLKAVLLDFNGVILDDEALHQQLIADLLLQENLQMQPGEFEQFCLGRSDRAALQDLLTYRGRVPSPAYLDKLIAQKAAIYQAKLTELPELPLFKGVVEFVQSVTSNGLKLALVTGALRSDVDFVLAAANLTTHFDVIVAAEDITQSKPDPEGYLLAVQRLGQQFPQLDILAGDCLVIEDSFAGIAAAKLAQIPVVGIANTYPFHFMQRRANWAVDYLRDLEMERIQAHFAGIKSLAA